MHSIIASSFAVVRSWCACAVIASGPIAVAQSPLGAAFTYQGKLTQGGNAYSGTADVQFRLFSASSGGSQIGSLIAGNVSVSAGLFTASVDFGDSAYDGDERWLEIGVRTPGNSAGAFTTLTPRQLLAAAPYASTALNALNAVISGTQPNAVTFNNAGNVFAGNGALLTNLSTGNLTGSLGSAQLSGTYASTVNLTNISNTFAGNGAGLTNLNAANIATGTLAIARGGTGATTAAAALTSLNGASLAAANTFIAGPQTIQTGSNGNRGLIVRGVIAQGVNLQEWQNSGAAVLASISQTGVFNGDGSGLTALNAANLATGTLPSNRFSGAYTQPVTLSAATNSFAGNGAGLTSLNASALGSGTVNDARLSSNVALLSGAQAFTGHKTLSGGVTVSNFTMNTGAIAGYVLRTDDTGFGSWQPPPTATGAAGGDLAGTYPNPGLATSAASLSKVSGGAMASVSGNIGVGTLSPTARLDVVAGPSNTRFTVSPGTLLGSANTSAVTIDTPGTGTIAVWDNFVVNNQLGVGTTSPQETLSIVGGMNVDQGGANTGTVGNTLRFGSFSGEAIGSNRNGGANSFGLDIYTAAAPRISITNSGNVGIGTTDPQAALHVNGTTRTKVITITGGADLAEAFAVSNAADPGSTVTPGMVVVIDPQRPGELMVSSSSFDRKVAGIVSGAKGLSAGMVMRAEGQPHVDGDHEIALTGRVWCWCDASQSPIEPGDLLTTSDIAGHAMKVGDAERHRAHGAVIGKAMTPLHEGRGLVLVLVNLQ